MRFGCFYGGERNRPYRMDDPHPKDRYPDDVHTGDAGRDGFTVMARAIPGIPESRPSVAGTVGAPYGDPFNDF